MAVVGFLTGLFRAAPSKRRLVRALRLDGRGGNLQVESRDGTAIAVRRSGAGAPVVIVHGTLDGMSSHSFVEVELAERHAVLVYDRRGRGGSGDGPEHSIDHEVDDLEAVIALADETAHVIGHSYGAVVALLAAHRGVAMRSLTLYEPPLNGESIDDAAVDEIRVAVVEDRRDDAIRTMALGLAGITDDEVAVAMGVPPVRKRLRDGVATAARELDSLRGVGWTGPRLSGVPTLVLRGERTGAAVYPTPAQVAALADGVETAEIPEQGHLAHVFAPYAWTDAVSAFLARN